MRLQLVLVAVWAVTHSYRLTSSRDVANFNINAHGIATTAHQSNSVALYSRGFPNSSAPSAFDAALRFFRIYREPDDPYRKTILDRLGPWISYMVAENHRNVQNMLERQWVDTLHETRKKFSLAIDGAAIVYKIMDGRSETKQAAKTWLNSKGLKEIYTDTDKKFMIWGCNAEKLVLIACKGTVLSDRDDLMVDGQITLDTLINVATLKLLPVSIFYNMSSRHQRNDAEAWLLLEDFQKWLKASGRSSGMSGFTVIVTGHSLGAPSASTFGKFLKGVQQEYGFKVLVYGIDPAPVKTAAYDYTLRDSNDPVSFAAPKGTQHLVFYDPLSDWNVQQTSSEVFFRAHEIAKLCSHEYRKNFINPEPEYWNDE